MQYKHVYQLTHLCQIAVTQIWWLEMRRSSPQGAACHHFSDFLHLFNRASKCQWSSTNIAPFFPAIFFGSFCCFNSRTPQQALPDRPKVDLALIEQARFDVDKHRFDGILVRLWGCELAPGHQRKYGAEKKRFCKRVVFPIERRSYG